MSFVNNYADSNKGNAIYFYKSSAIYNCIFSIYRPKKTATVNVKNLIYDAETNYPVAYYKNGINIVNALLNNGITFNNLHNGKNTIKMVFNGFSNYIIITGDTYLRAKNILMFYNDGTKYKVKLTNYKGNPLVNKNVKITIANKNYYVKTNKKGYAILLLKQKPGKYLVITRFNGDRDYGSSLYKTTLKIIKSPITENKNMIIYFLGGTFKVKIIKLNKKSVGAGKTVKFTIDGKTYAKKTNKNGYAKYEILQKSGKYTITTKYSKFKQKNTIKIKPVLTANNVVKKKTKTTIFKAKLIKTNGKANPKKTITFKFEGKTYKQTTNKHRIATLKIKNLKIGKYKIYSKYKKSTIKKHNNNRKIRNPNSLF